MPVPPREIAQLRLAAQRLVGPGLPTAAEAVHWMTAMQAQDYPGALTSVALRTADRSTAGVVAALDAGSIVRSWPMRGTLHFLAPEDLGWMQALTTPRLVTGAATRRAGLGLTEAHLERARELAVTALTGGGRLRRTDLLAVFDGGGVSTQDQRGYHLLWHLSQTGTVCLGPTHGTEQLFVLVSEWITAPRVLARTESLGEWALRFFCSHGPATLADFVRWTGLKVTDARTGVALARDRLDEIEGEGGPLLLDPATPDLLADHRARARGVLLLPGFDEFVLGYGDRSAAVPPAYADAIVPGGNGMFRSTVVDGGRVVGTWVQTGRGDRRRIEATPFTSFNKRVEAALPKVYAALP